MASWQRILLRVFQSIITFWLYFYDTFITFSKVIFSWTNSGCFMPVNDSLMVQNWFYNSAHLGDIFMILLWYFDMWYFNDISLMFLWQWISTLCFKNIGSSKHVRFTTNGLYRGFTDQLNICYRPPVCESSLHYISQTWLTVSIE